MKKTTIKIINIIIIIMLIISIMPLQIVKSSTNYNKSEYSNMLQNNGFEDGVKHWNIWNASGNLNIEIDEEVKKEGIYSIKLFNNNYNARGSISQIIENNDNNLENMVLEQYIKALNFIGSFKIRIDFLDSSWNKIKESDIKEVNIKNSNEWNKYKYSISSKGIENVKYIKIEYLFDNSKGNIWIDEIKLEKTGEIHTFGDIQNGGFEEGASYWTKWSNDANIEIDNNIVKEGNSSLKISSENKGRASIVQNIKIPDDEIKSVNISQWIKTENISGNGIKLRIRFIDGQGNEIGNKKILALEIGRNTEWSNLKYDIGLPQNNVRELQIEYLYDNCEGIVWIDEIYTYFSEDDIVENMILNPSFEATVDDIIDVWKSWGNINLKLDTDIKSDKNNSLLIYSNDKSNGAIYQSIDINEDIVGKDIRLKQYIKTNNVESKEIKVLIKFLDENNDEIENSQSHIIELNDSKEWNELNINFDIPNNNEITGIILEYRFKEFSGNFWIDNIFMENYKKISTVNINPSYIEVEVNKNIEIETNVIPEDSTYKNLNYEISDDSIAIINNKIVTGKKSGVTKLIISETSNNFKKEIPIIVLGGDFRGMEPEKKQNIKLNESYNDYIGNIYEKYEVFIKPASGYLILSEDGYIEYYPQSVGSASFVIKVEDKNNNVKLIQYTIDISDNSFKALGEDFLISLTKNEQFKTGKIITNSFNNRNIKFSILKYPENGEISIDENGYYKYTPNEGFSGYDSVKVELSSGLRLKEVVIGTIFVSPSFNNINNVHPKIILNDKLINRINSLITNEDANMSEWYNKIKVQANSILNKPVIKYNKIDNEKIDTTSKQYIQDLSFMYLLTNDEKYADRAWLEIENICNYNDWNNSFLLDTVALSVAVAIGYDWLYNYLSIDQREFIEKNIKSKSLDLFKEYYNENSHFFIENDANWNIVANSGSIVSSIAISNPGNKEYCNEIISLGLKSLQKSIINYYSDGNSYEGPEYWAFSTEYLMYMIETTENILEDGYFNNIIDFYKLGEVPNHIVGIDGVFNYGDSRNFDIAGYLSLWLADKTQSPELTDYHKKNIIKNNSISIFDIIWYEPNIYNKEVELVKDKYFPETGIITMKSSISSNEIGFVGIKGGKNGVAHGDLDIGSFIFERDGIRWAIDLGKDDYSLPGYFDNGEYGERWSYYKKRAEGNNTLTIGSKDKEDQTIGASAVIIKNDLNTESPSVVMDITQAYKEAVKVTRSFTFENREDLIIEDNFILKSEEEVVWQMHTDSDIEISEDKKSITLRKEGRVCIIQLENEDLRFEAMEVNSITSNLESKTDEDINNIRKIFVKTKTQKGSFKIRFKLGTYENSSINMIKNAGFESGLNEWNKWISSGSFKVEADNTVAKEG
ncbi:MAG: heparinase II/III family protein, partial [Clostridium celatum]|nr:heparinase II/III family protein [Clostridium celatum]